MANIFLPGQSVELVQDEAFWPSQLDKIMDGTVVGAGRIPRGRSGDNQSEVFPVEDVQPTDIIEIELEDGLKIWQSVESTQTDFQADASRSAADQSLLVPRHLSFTDQAEDSRGLRDHLVKAIRVLRGDPVGKAGELTALKLAEKIEETIDPGFYRCTRGMSGGAGQIERRKAKADDVPTDKKILVFLHGTFSSTEGSFGDLALAPSAEVWNKLDAAYPGGIFALEHKSVTQSPVRNATDLVKALPKGAQISLMSHSRGGMIAELICRSAREDIADTDAIDDTDIEIFQKIKGRRTQVTELRRLREALADKALKVDRVIRVAGPIAGTTLASERLDRYLSVALNVFELVPILKRTGAADLLKAFMLGFIRTKADPKTLPGLEAMMPKSPLAAMLNRPDVRYGNQLSVIGGDTRGSGILKRLAVLSADLFFRADHDFVVNTASMSRGGARSKQAKPFLVEGPEVTHFSYFHNPVSRREIIGAAIEDDTSFVMVPQSRGVLTGGLPPEETFPDLTSRAGANAPVCFVLPGVMGSHLSQDGDWIWTNPLKIPFGGLDRISIDKASVSASGSLKSHYWDLARYISRSHKVIAFDYDWRLSILEQGHSSAVRKLGKLVQDELDRTEHTGQPIRFMAHSMGGLVVRALFQSRPDLWARVKRRPNSRFVMLGTPNGGSFSMMRTLLGRDSAIRKLEMVDLKHDMTELLSIVAGMNGALQLLPGDEDGRYLGDPFWEQLHQLHGSNWVKPSSNALQIARDGRKSLTDHVLDPALTCYVAGLGTSNTPSSVKLDPSAQGADRIKFFATPQGDGTVTWKTGIPDGIKTWYLDAVHGDLPRTESAFPAYLELLRTGTTEKLNRQPPILSRGDADQEAILREDPIDVYPDQDDILNDFLGSARITPIVAPEKQQPVRVSLLHGNLRFASYPLAVGHYIDSPMTGAERDLDTCLDHDLSRVRDLGLYPGDIETCEVVLRDDQSPKGAVVLGLGSLGSLSPGKLKDSFRQAVLRYCLIVRERRKEQGATDSDPDLISLSTLLIGHRGTNMSVQQSVEAILQAVAEANRVLGDAPHIEHLQFVELFDDTAHQAASALDNLRSLGRIGKLFAFDGEVRRTQDARVRTHLDDQSDLWRRITVTREDPRSNTLKYVVVSDTARSELDATVIQPKVIQNLLNQRESGTETNREIGKLLFELLIPLELKTFARDNQNITLELDEHTAVYPWELMEDDFKAYEFDTGENSDDKDAQAGLNKPMVIRAPVIRKLITSGANVPRANTKSALVVGDPKSDLSVLTGARREARTVERLLQNENWAVDSLIEVDDGFDVIKSIMLRPAKLIHLAGHGVYKNDTFDQTGMVLGTGLYLTVSEIEQMRYVPELVFLNCCHTGYTGNNRSEIAASLSVALIRRGVKAVIAAGWEVDDTAADLFAHEFYSAMLEGESFGRAVHRARQRTFEKKPDKNTWGAYQCYGDESYRFNAAERDDQGMRPDDTKYYSVHQATRAAENVAESAASARQKRATLLDRLDAIEQSSRASWQGNSGWHHAMGWAYTRLDAYEDAIDHLESAISHPKSTGSFDTIEMLEELRLERASREWRTATGEAARKLAAHKLETTAKSALQCLERLDEFGQQPTTRRECLKGTAYKRLVQIKTDGPRQTALGHMIERYFGAMQIVFQSDPDRIHLDAGINWVIGIILSDMLARASDTSPGSGSGVSVGVWLDRIRSESARRDKEDPCFHNGIVQAQTEVLRGLHDPAKASDETLNSINGIIRKIWRRGGSYQQAQSLRTQITFIRQLMANVDPKRSEWLEKIEREVDELTGDFN